jgi:putative oxidoreductase
MRTRGRAGAPALHSIRSARSVLRCPAPELLVRLPLPDRLRARAARSRFAWLALRLTVAGLIAAHGWARLLAGGVVPFGKFLDSQGFPGGLYLAALVTAIEIIGSIALVVGKAVAPLCAAFALIYATGIALVHAKAGWFVVGLGRNGAEYSVLLIVCVLAVGLQHLQASEED